MKLAVIGSRTLTIENIGDYLPEGVTEMISGGAKGIDTAPPNTHGKTASDSRNSCRNTKDTVVPLP